MQYPTITDAATYFRHAMPYRTDDTPVPIHYHVAEGHRDQDPHTYDTPEDAIAEVALVATTVTVFRCTNTACPFYLTEG